MGLREGPKGRFLLDRATNHSVVHFYYDTSRTPPAVKKYKCIFKTARGNTTIEVAAEDAERAVIRAGNVVTSHADSIEIWDETGLVLSRQPVPTILKDKPLPSGFSAA